MRVNPGHRPVKPAWEDISDLWAFLEDGADLLISPWKEKSCVISPQQQAWSLTHHAFSTNVTHVKKWPCPHMLLFPFQTLQEQEHNFSCKSQWQSSHKAQTVRVGELNFNTQIVPSATSFQWVPR